MVAQRLIHGENNDFTKSLRSVEVINCGHIPYGIRLRVSDRDDQILEYYWLVTGEVKEVVKKR